MKSSSMYDIMIVFSGISSLLNNHKFFYELLSARFGSLGKEGWGSFRINDIINGLKLALCDASNSGNFGDSNFQLWLILRLPL